jgi:hypothetical protein
MSVIDLMRAVDRVLHESFKVSDVLVQYLRHRDSLLRPTSIARGAPSIQDALPCTKSRHERRYRDERGETRGFLGNPYDGP